MSIDHIVIVIPACNEADTIRACLHGVDVARRRLPSAVATSIVVVADSCDDDTVASALDALCSQANDVVLVTGARSAATARRLGTDWGLLDLDVPLERVWVANTDADTVVAPDWLNRQLAAEADGFVAVAGIVELDVSTIQGGDLVDTFTESYVHFADGTHPHVHGANLGFRADAYRAGGGWNPLATGENHDLWTRLRRHGPVTSSTALSVSTSARLLGRAPGGYAANLAALVEQIDTVA